MKPLKDPYLGPDTTVDMMVYRDSRHAFGHRFEVERRNRDWMWFAGTLAVIITLAWVLV